ncbi:MAG: heme exporter protein CcmB, partial [Pseudomonadales bacterium]|nr:heme exporter protein CcmB [Pseudomonadales bacterium]
MGIFTATILRDLRITYRNPAEIMNPLIFFVIVVTLFPLGISPSREVLADIAPGVIWVAALLATLLSLELLFRSDYDDGSLEQMVMSNEPFIMIVIGKMVSHWLSSGLFLTLLSPLLALMLFVNADGIQALVLSLLLGTPILSLIGSIGAGLTVGLRRVGVL